MSTERGHCTDYVVIKHGCYKGVDMTIWLLGWDNKLIIVCSNDLDS